MKLTQNTRKDLLNYLLLGIFMVIAYLPVSSFLFALKNDALTDNFPNKYFFSASLHAGYLPLWNPYMNFGLPLYADPGFAFWEPITWLFGFIGYNIYTLTVEVLFYIWLSGVFMYELGKYFKHSLTACFLMAIMYMSCGFFIGNLQHINFITCAAFLPIVIKTFLQLQEEFTYRRLLYCALSLYFLTTGGHPAIPFATFYFLIAIFLGLFFLRNRENEKKFHLQSIKSNLVLLVFFAALIAPMLYSYWEIMFYINRSNPVNQNTNGYAGFSIASYLSFLFPFITTAENDTGSFFNNNSLMRNGYFSFIGFAFFIVSIFSKKNKWQIIFLYSGILMLILSLGGSVKTFLYPYLPFLKYIRTNGEYRVFSILSFIVVASFPLNKSLENSNNRLFNKILFIFAGICSLAVLWLLIHPSLLFFSTNGSSNDNLPDKMKWWLDNLNLYDRVFISAGLLAFLLLLFFILRKKLGSGILFSVIMITDLLFFSWMHLPVTGVQKRSVASINNYFSEIQSGIPVPAMEPIKNNIRSGENINKVIGCWAYYSKQPGTPGLCDYPVFFNGTKNYFQSDLIPMINERPFIFLKNYWGDSSVITVQQFSPESIMLSANCKIADTLVLLQNYYPKWHAIVNSEPVGIQKAFISFMSVPLQVGDNHILFYFRNRKILVYFFISMIALSIVIGLSIYMREAK